MGARFVTVCKQNWKIEFYGSCFTIWNYELDRLVDRDYRFKNWFTSVTTKLVVTQFSRGGIGLAHLIDSFGTRDIQ